MSAFVLWIDHEHANAFALTDGAIHKTSVEARHQEHHTHRETSFDREDRAKKMYGEAAKLLSHAEQVLVVGPGLAKHHFTNYLAEHLPALYRKVAGCENMDHPTDRQIRAFAEKYFARQAQTT